MIDQQELLALAAKAKAIPTAEIRQDLADTLAEINVIERRIRLLQMQLGDREKALHDHRTLVAKLEALIAYREDAKEAQS